MTIYDPFAIALDITPTIHISEYPKIEQLLEEHPPVIQDVRNTGHSAMMSSVNKILVEEGEHHLLKANGGTERARKENLRRVENKTHPFMKGGSYYEKRLTEGLNPFAGEKGSAMHKKLLAEGKHQSQILRECPHCGKNGRAPGIFKSHFKNCKLFISEYS